ncbi:MAG: hypothetical protein P4L67_04375 [Candidatus Pacebacteria bacterium]|nr:hypothetical protein [Candidatus Paceibacterota bacterium]
MRFTVRQSTIETMNGEYEVLPTGLVLKTEEESGIAFQNPLKPDIAHVINWMVVFGSPGVIQINGKKHALSTGNAWPILDDLGFRDWRRDKA